MESSTRQVCVCVCVCAQEAEVGVWRGCVCVERVCVCGEGVCVCVWRGCVCVSRGEGVFRHLTNIFAGIKCTPVSVSSSRMGLSHSGLQKARCATTISKHGSY